MGGAVESIGICMLRSTKGIGENRIDWNRD